MEKESNSKRNSNWAKLNPPILDLILSKLVPVSDYLRFGAVCKGWRTTARRHKHRRIKPSAYTNHQLPFLFVYDYYSKLYNVINKKDGTWFWNRRWRSQIPNVYYNCCGSSHGWLAFLLYPQHHSSPMPVMLVNPSSCRRRGGSAPLPPIHLPPLTRRDQIKKIVISADPSLRRRDYRVVAIYGEEGKLAWIRSGAIEWNYINCAKCNAITDVRFSGDVVYTVDRFKRLMTVDLEKNSAKIIVTRSSETTPRTNHLVEFGGEMMVVEEQEKEAWVDLRYGMNEPFIANVTTRFEVFKVATATTTTKKLVWVEVKSIGDKALFLGGNSDSVCVSASDCSGCRSNCIYFWNGVFGLEDGNIQRHTVNYYRSYSNPLHFPDCSYTFRKPGWIVPTL